MKIYNHDVFQLVRRMRRFKEELLKSVSSGVSELNEYDKNRLWSYLNAIKAFKGWVVAQPQLDLPESSPMEIEVSEMVPALDMENDDAALIINLYELIEKEMLNSQSARRSTGLISHDSIRFDTYIAKIERFINDYIDVATPLDLPESSPTFEMTGPGRVGA